MAGTFDFIKFGSKMKDKQKKVRAAFEALNKVVNEVLPCNDAKKTVASQLEIAYAMAGRSLRAEQIVRNARA